MEKAPQTDQHQVGHSRFGQFLLVGLICLLLFLAFLIFLLEVVLDDPVCHTRRRVLRQLFLDTTEAFDQKQVPYWADFGTLLGVYRDRDIIIGDRDVDLALMKADQERAWQALQPLRKKGYRLENTGIKLNVWRKAGFTELRSEIMFYQDVEQNSIRESILTFSRDLVFPLKQHRWWGRMILVPQRTEDYLVAEYGDTWKIPRDGDKGKEGEAKGQSYNKVVSKVKRWSSTLADSVFLWDH